MHAFRFHCKASTAILLLLCLTVGSISRCLALDKEDVVQAIVVRKRIFQHVRGAPHRQLDGEGEDNLSVQGLLGPSEENEKRRWLGGKKGGYGGKGGHGGKKGGYEGRRLKGEKGLADEDMSMLKGEESDERKKGYGGKKGGYDGRMLNGGYGGKKGGYGGKKGGYGGKKGGHHGRMLEGKKGGYGGKKEGKKGDKRHLR